MDWSQVLRLRSLLKRDAPREKEGRGPEINTDFPQLLSKLRSSLKCFFVISDWRREVSLNPRWITSFSTEAGSETSNSGRFLRRFGTVEPGKQCVTALTKRMFLMMESPIIAVVGGKSGRADVDEGESLPDNNLLLAGGIFTESRRGKLLE